MITNRNGRIIWANQALSSLTGYGINELEGSTPGLFKSGVQDHAFYLQLWKTIAAGAVWHGQIVDRRKDGSLFTVEEIVTPLLSSHGIPRHYVATLQDITAREASH